MKTPKMDKGESAKEAAMEKKDSGGKRGKKDRSSKRGGSR